MSRSFLIGDKFKMRILIADANHRNRSIRARSLNLLGYRVDEASSDQQAQAKVDLEHYDVMLLNLDTSTDDSQELISLALETQPWLLLIVLTESPTLDSAIKAIKAGVSDYLLEPVSIQDIFRSIALALQRQATEKWNMLDHVSQLMDELRKSESASDLNADSQVEPDVTVKTVGTLKLDLKSRHLAIDGDTNRAVQLTDGAAALLTGLMAHPNRVLSCQRIAKISWGYDVPEDQAQSIVRPAIYRLRRRVEANPASPVIIRTVRGRGYMLTPDSDLQFSDGKQ